MTTETKTKWPTDWGGKPDWWDGLDEEHHDLFIDEAERQGEEGRKDYIDVLNKCETDDEREALIYCLPGINSEHWADMDDEENPLGCMFCCVMLAAVTLATIIVF